MISIPAMTHNGGLTDIFHLSQLLLIADFLRNHPTGSIELLLHNIAHPGSNYVILTYQLITVREIDFFGRRSTYEMSQGTLYGIPSSKHLALEVGLVVFVPGSRAIDQVGIMRRHRDDQKNSSSFSVEPFLQPPTPRSSRIEIQPTTVLTHTEAYHKGYGGILDSVNIQDGMLYGGGLDLLERERYKKFEKFVGLFGV